ncbi:entericidin A/B family lipoprotein [Methylobacillus arboreus]|nr:entericidin A/B family lipoprotein [Methylobacillus arboreus]MCB5189589.1 entericidin A/B family lipoprotein [Methylobacillus arboreus]
MKQLITSIALLLAILPLTACNTVHGVGKDIEKAGEAIQRSTK